MDSAAIAAPVPVRRPAPRLRAVATLLIPLLVLPALIAGITVLMDFPILHGGLAEPDSYMKLVRAEQLLATGTWYDGTILRSNAPYGDVLHWTRLFDVVLVVLASPLMPFTGVKTALYWAGVALSPIFLALTGIAGLALLRQIAGSGSRAAWPLLLLPMLAQPLVLGYGMPGRVGHHALLYFLFAVLLLALFKCVRPPAHTASRRSEHFAILAGVIAALGLWASIEFLIAVIAAAAALGLIWLIEGGRRLRANLAFAWSFAITTLLALVAERPPADWLTAEFDRLSIAHVTAAGTLALVWAGLGVLQHTGLLGRPIARAIGAAFAGALGGALLYALYPALYVGPEAHIDPALAKIWQSHVGELAPLWPTSVAGAARFIGFLGLAAIGLILTLRALVTLRNGGAWRCQLALAVVLAATVLFGLSHLRLAVYPELFALLAWARPVAALFRRSEAWRAALARAAVRGGTVIGLMFGPAVAAQALGALRAEPGDKGQLFDTPACSVRAIAPFLDSPASPWGGQPQTVLIHAEYGPELLYRTRHRVIATPYHRNLRGMIDGFNALAGDEAGAGRIIRERNVGVIVICLGGAEQALFADAGRDSLYARMARGELPGWVKPVALPASYKTAHRIFVVTP